MFRKICSLFLLFNLATSLEILYQEAPWSNAFCIKNNSYPYVLFQYQATDWSRLTYQSSKTGYQDEEVTGYQDEEVTGYRETLSPPNISNYWVMPTSRTGTICLQSKLGSVADVEAYPLDVTHFGQGSLLEDFLLWDFEKKILATHTWDSLFNHKIYIHGKIDVLFREEAWTRNAYFRNPDIWLEIFPARVLKFLPDYPSDRHIYPWDSFDTEGVGIRFAAVLDLPPGNYKINLHLKAGNRTLFYLPSFQNGWKVGGGWQSWIIEERDRYIRV